jgi:hypothetical protein
MSQAGGPRGAPLTSTMDANESSGRSKVAATSCSRRFDKVTIASKYSVATGRKAAGFAGHWLNPSISLVPSRLPSAWQPKYIFEF